MSCLIIKNGFVSSFGLQNSEECNRNVSHDLFIKRLQLVTSSEKEKNKYFFATRTQEVVENKTMTNRSYSDYFNVFPCFIIE